MTPDVIAAIASGAGALVVAVVGYVLTKRAEREAEWRSEKLEHYKAFVASLSGVIAGETSDEGQRVFARACNDLLLFAPDAVLIALNRFRDEISERNLAKSQERHDKLLAELLYTIRRDLRIKAGGGASTFPGRLWASGSRQDEMGSLRSDPQSRTREAR